MSDISVVIELTDRMSNTINSICASLNNMNATFEHLQASVNAGFSSSAINNFDGSMQNASTSASQLNESAMRASDSMSQASNSASQTSESMTKASDSATKASASAEKASESMAKTSENATKTSESATKASESTDKTAKSAEKASRHTEDTAKHTKDAAQNANVLSKYFNAVGTAALAMGTAVTALAGYSIKVGSSFSSSMSQVAATMGIQKTNEEYEMLANAAKEAGKTTQFSAAESADALNYLALAGYKANQAVSALPTVLNLATAGGMELASASDMITDACSALGIGMSDMEGFADKIARTAQRSNTSVSMLGEAILTVGATANYLKGGTTELNTALGILADAHFKGAEGGTKLRNVMTSLMSSEDKATTALEQLGVSVYDAEGKMRSLNKIFIDMQNSFAGLTQVEQISYLTDIFNSRDLAAAQTLINNCTDRWDELTAEINNSSGAMQEMANTMNDNLAGDMKSLLSAFESVGNAISEKFEQPLRNSVQSVVGIFRNIGTQIENGHLTSSFERLGESISKIIQLVATFAQGALPVAINVVGRLLEAVANVSSFIVDNWSLIAPIVGGIVAALGYYYLAVVATNVVEGISNGLKALAAFFAFAHGKATAEETAQITGATKAQLAFNASLLANPLTIVIAIIIAVIAVIYLFVAVLNKCAGTSISATGVIIGAFSVLVAVIWNIFLGLLDLIFGCLEYIFNGFIDLANFLGNVFNDPIGSIIHLFGDMADDVLGIIQKIATAIDDVFGTGLASGVANFRSSVADLANKAAEKFGNGNYEVKFEKIDFSTENLGFERFDFGDAWNGGYYFGSSLSDKFDSLDIQSILGGNNDIDEFLNKMSSDDTTSGNSIADASNTANDIANTADNTKSVAESVSLTEEDMKYLRELAEQETVNRFTTAEIKVEMTNNNNINSNLDLDGIISEFSDRVDEAINVMAEGVM